MPYRQMGGPRPPTSPTPAPLKILYTRYPQGRHGPFARPGGFSPVIFVRFLYFCTTATHKTGFSQSCPTVCDSVRQGRLLVVKSKDLLETMAWGEPGSARPTLAPETSGKEGYTSTSPPLTLPVLHHG